MSTHYDIHFPILRNLIDPSMTDMCTSQIQTVETLNKTLGTKAIVFQIKHFGISPVNKQAQNKGNKLMGIREISPF